MGVGVDNDIENKYELTLLAWQLKKEGHIQEHELKLCSIYEIVSAFLGFKTYAAYKHSDNEGIIILPANQAKLHIECGWERTYQVSGLDQITSAYIADVIEEEIGRSGIKVRYQKEKPEGFTWTEEDC
jgi:hypothetical protein